MTVALAVFSMVVVGAFVDFVVVQRRDDMAHRVPWSRRLRAFGRAVWDAFISS